MEFSVRERSMLESLYDATNEACKAVVDAHAKDGLFINHAINFSDLKCSCAEWYQDNHGDSGYRVYVDEADNSDTELRSFIQAFLLNRGFNAYVQLEW